ncbi:MAG: gliding motility-associated C-terminal domain-containing protein [Saprospiraceae bacterium]
MKRLFNFLFSCIVILLLSECIEAQPLEFYDVKDSLQIKDIQVHATSDTGWINIALTEDSSILIVKHNYCGNIQYIKKFKVDSFALSDLHTNITRINRQDSVYLTAVLESPNFHGIYCLSIYATKGDIQFPKITTIPNSSLFTNPSLIANGNDRLLTFNAGNSETDLVGHAILMDNIFQFKDDLKLKDNNTIRQALSLETDGYFLSIGNRLICKLFNNLQFDYVYTLDTNYTHFNHNLVQSINNNIVLIGDYKKDNNSAYYTLIKFNLLTKKSEKVDKLVAYYKALTPKIIYYKNFYTNSNENYAVTHLSYIGVNGGAVHSISKFSGFNYINTESYKLSTAYTPISYGLDYLPFENNFAMAGSYVDTFRYFSAKLNKNARISNCHSLTFQNSTIILDFLQDTFDLLTREVFPQPVVNSTVRDLSYSFDYKRLCTYFDFIQGATSLEYCKGNKDTVFIISAIAKDPDSYRNPFVKYLWTKDPITNVAGTAITDSIKYNLDKKDYLPKTVVVTYCNEVSSLSYNPNSKDCTPLVRFANIFTPSSEIPEDKAYGLVISDEDKVKISNIDWMIYNRWGAEVFSSTNYSDEWDGTNNGNPAPSETYILKVIVKDIYDFVSNYSGMFTLVR